MSAPDSTKVTTLHPKDEAARRGAMGTADIVFFVLAGVSPMGVVVALLTISVALGNGPGVPGAYLVAGVVLALFSVGYVRMSRRITNVGGFYTYAREGLSDRVGGSTAYVALLAYNAATIGIFGALAYFSAEVLTEVVGSDVPWQPCAVVSVGLVAVLAYFEVTLSAKVLGVALAAEVLLLLGFDIAVLVDKGFHGFSLDVFTPGVVFAGGFGVSLMLAFGSYVGFEATALYGEEARDPHRTVPRATYISLALITGFYLVTTWASVTAWGVDKAQDAALTAAGEGTPENYVFDKSTDLIGQGFTDLMGILVMTSLFAAFLAFHCNTARYHVALARDGLLPRVLASTHPRHGSPVAASAAQLALVAAITVGFTIAGQHPYLGMGLALYGLGVLGIVLLQALAAFSIVGFFLRHREDESILSALVAPALGGLGLVAGLVLMIANYPALTGVDITWVNSLPWALPVAAGAGALAAGRLATSRAGVEDHSGLDAGAR